MKDIDRKTLKAFEEYEELKLQAKEIEEKLKELQPIVMAAVPEGKEIAANHGVFYLQNRSTWKYSAKLQAVESDLKDQKKEEQAKGIAEATVQSTLYYKVNAS